MSTPNYVPAGPFYVRSDLVNPIQEVYKTNPQAISGIPAGAYVTGVAADKRSVTYQMNDPQGSQILSQSQQNLLNLTTVAAAPTSPEQAVAQGATSYIPQEQKQVYYNQMANVYDVEMQNAEAAQANQAARQPEVTQSPPASSYPSLFDMSGKPGEPAPIKNESSLTLPVGDYKDIFSFGIPEGTVKVTTKPPAPTVKQLAPIDQEAILESGLQASKDYAVTPATDKFPEITGVIPPSERFEWENLTKPEQEQVKVQAIRQGVGTVGLFALGIAPGAALMGAAVSVPISQAFKAAPTSIGGGGGGLLTVNEFADAFLGGAAFSGVASGVMGSIAASKLAPLVRGVGSGTTKAITGATGRIGVNTGLGAGGGYLVSGGKTEGAIQGAAFGAAFGIVGEAAGFINTKLATTKTEPQISTAKKSVSDLDLYRQNVDIDDYLNSAKKSAGNSEIESYLKNGDFLRPEIARANSRITEVIAQKEGGQIDIESKINAVLQERNAFLASQQKPAVTSVSNFREGFTSDLPSNVKSDYLIKMPERSNLNLSDQIRISGRNQIDIAGASAKMDKLVNTMPNESYGNYKTLIGQGRTAITTKAKPAIVNPEQLTNIETMLTVNTMKTASTIPTSKTIISPAFREDITNPLPSNVKRSYLIKQPERSNLALSDQIQITGRNSINVAGASTRMDNLLNEGSSKFSYSDYKAIIGQGRTAVATKPKPTIVNPDQLTEIENMLKPTTLKPILPTSTYETSPQNNLRLIPSIKEGNAQTLASQKMSSLLSGGISPSMLNIINRRTTPVNVPNSSRRIDLAAGFVPFTSIRSPTTNLTPNQLQGITPKQLQSTTIFDLTTTKTTETSTILDTAQKQQQGKTAVRLGLGNITSEAGSGRGDFPNFIGSISIKRKYPIKTPEEFWM